MKKIQSMPDIWNSGDEFLTSREEILGALACWAVRLSPYSWPKCLGLGLREFKDAFNPCLAFNIVNDDYFETNCSSLIKRIIEAFEKCPTIRSWNINKAGNDVFVSGYHTVKPDYDFIGLDALARNIAHSITLEAKYQQLHN